MMTARYERFLPLFFFAVLAAAAPAGAQTVVVPATPTEFETRGISGGSSSNVGVVQPPASGTRVVTIEYTAVTPIRVWTNREGSAMQARLLAFSAPAEGETGPVEVIREGKVRFLLEDNPRPVDYDLDKLSETDRTYIYKLADAARHEAPKKVRTETTEVDANE